MSPQETIFAKINSKNILLERRKYHLCVQIPYICYNVSEIEDIYMAIQVKENRIEFRLPSDAKKTIEDAARLLNISLSSYILSVVLKQAKLDLEQNEVISLNNKDRDMLMLALAKPPKANDALKALFK